MADVFFTRAGGVPQTQTLFKRALLVLQRRIPSCVLIRRLPCTLCYLGLDPTFHCHRGAHLHLGYFLRLSTFYRVVVRSDSIRQCSGCLDAEAPSYKKATWQLYSTPPPSKIQPMRSLQLLEVPRTSPAATPIPQDGAQTRLYSDLTLRQLDEHLTVSATSYWILSSQGFTSEP
jgi:hypothetical protein